MTSMIVLVRTDTFENSPVAVFDDLAKLNVWIDVWERFWGESAILDKVNHQFRLGGSKYHWLEVPYYETEKEL